tara:strand:- start:282 stop:1496 length:1215 start_codon:yes stop_codon:yes gene_type:complete
MPYYLEGMNLIEGQEQEQEQEQTQEKKVKEYICGDRVPVTTCDSLNWEKKEESEQKCPFFYQTIDNNICASGSDGRCVPSSECPPPSPDKPCSQRISNPNECSAIRPVGAGGVEEGGSMSSRSGCKNYYSSKSGNKCTWDKDQRVSEWKTVGIGIGSLDNCIDDDKCEDEDEDEGRENKETDLSKKLEELMSISENLTSVLMDQIKKINDITSEKLYSGDRSSSEYINKISKISLIELGDPNNSNELDFMENVIINFLDISDNNLGDLLKNLCGEDLNVNILLTLAIFYNRNNDEFNNIRDNNLVNIDRLLNRLGRYLPDIFQKILTGMKMCPGASDKYVVLEHIYKKMFKFNETNVDLGLMNGITSIFRYLKEMKTVEMVVVILAFAFVVSKIFDMFRVKVDV